MTELEVGHGLQVAGWVLHDEGLYELSPGVRAELINHIRNKVSHERWEAISALLKRDADDMEFDFLLVGIWADLCQGLLTDLWLAAMALHAHYVQGNDFAFGHLVALLSQRLELETHYLRGRKSVESGKNGAAVQAHNRHLVTQFILREMKHHRARGHSISRAAEFTFKTGLGASAGANRKLWSRHTNRN